MKLWLIKNFPISVLPFQPTDILLLVPIYVYLIGPWVGLFYMMTNR